MLVAPERDLTSRQNRLTLILDNSVTVPALRFLEKQAM